MDKVPNGEIKDGKVYMKKTIDPKDLAKFRKKQKIVLAGRVNEDIYIQLKDGRKIFVDAGDYIYLDVDKKLKTMDKKNFEQNHEIELGIKFVTVKIRKEVEDAMYKLMEDLKRYEGQIHENAMKITKSNDINIVSGHLILAGISSVRESLNLIDVVNRKMVSRQQKRKRDREAGKKGLAQ